MKKELVKNEFELEEMKKDFFAKEAELAAKELSDLELGKVSGGEKYTKDSQGIVRTHYGHVPAGSVKMNTIYSFTNDNNTYEWFHGLVYDSSCVCSTYTFTVMDWTNGGHRKIKSSDWTAWKHTVEGHLDFG